VARLVGRDAMTRQPVRVRAGVAGSRWR
jgi:hypothetical protein